MATTKPQDRKKKARVSEQSDLTVTSTADWKAQKGPRTWDVQLPSGNVAKLRHASLETFLQLGIIPNSLIAVIQPQIERAQEGKKVKKDDIDDAMRAAMNDPERMAEILDLADNICVYVVVEPKVLKAPENEEDRDESMLYVDEVDMNDKMFIFNWAVGGSQKADKFLGQLQQGVEPVHDGEDVDG